MFILLLLSQMNGLCSLAAKGSFSTTVSAIKIRNRLEVTCGNTAILPAPMHMSRLCPFSGVQNTYYTASNLPQCPMVFPTETLAMTGLVWRGQ